MSENVLEEVKRMESEIKSLQSQVKNLQGKCHHQWKLTKKPDLKKTLVDGVYVGSIAISGRITIECPETLRFICECEKCGLEKTGDAAYECPHCVVQLREWKHLENREGYFGCDYNYYAIGVSDCPECDFRIASDVYDR